MRAQCSGCHVRRVRLGPPLHTPPSKCWLLPPVEGGGVTTKPPGVPSRPARHLRLEVARIARLPPGATAPADPTAEVARRVTSRSAPNGATESTESPATSEPPAVKCPPRYAERHAATRSSSHGTSHTPSTTSATISRRVQPPRRCQRMTRPTTPCPPRSAPSDTITLTAPHSRQCDPAGEWGRRA